MTRYGPSLYSSCSLSVFPLGRAAVGQRVTVWKLLPKHAFEAEFRDTSSSPPPPNPLRSTNSQAALNKGCQRCEISLPPQRRLARDSLNLFVLMIFCSETLPWIAMFPLVKIVTCYLRCLASIFCLFPCLIEHDRNAVLVTVVSFMTS